MENYFVSYCLLWKFAGFSQSFKNSFLVDRKDETEKPREGKVKKKRKKEAHRETEIRQQTVVRLYILHYDYGVATQTNSSQLCMSSSVYIQSPLIQHCVRACCLHRALTMSLLCTRHIGLVCELVNCEKIILVRFFNMYQ